MRRVGLAFLLLVALFLRVHDLATFGFSEDEVAKLRAIEAYRQGDLSPNAEHPMLMKLAMWASLSTASAWNAQVPYALTLSPEAALRLPNALAGTATVAAAYGCAAILFGVPAALFTAAFVAFDPTIIAINRLGKEDTFLVFFFLAAVYAYERAKVVGAADPGRAQFWYRCAGAAFGLMLASKYLPHLLGLYGLYNIVAQRDPGRNAPAKTSYYLTMVGTFLLVNPAVLLPSTWEYWVEYTRGGHSAHHGYLYDGQIYVNAAHVVLHGVPWYYYLHLITTKVPLVVLAGAVAGLIPLVTRRGDRGFVFLRVLLVVQLIGYAAFASKFQRYVLPLLIIVEMLAAVGLATWLQAMAGGLNARIRQPILRASSVVLIAIVLMTPLGAAPFYSTYQNPIGRALAPPLEAFPEEAYDFAVREAVALLADVAAPGATIVSDASMVVEHYLRTSGRDDLVATTLSSDSIRLGGEYWVLVQDSHIYFENASQVAQLRQAFEPWHEYRIRGTTVLQIFRLVL